MADLFARGRLVDLVLAIVAIEMIVLLLYWKRTKGGVAPLDLLPNLGAGIFLLLALRVTLGGADWRLAGLCLAAAGLAHLADLYRRWSR